MKQAAEEALAALKENAGFAFDSEVDRDALGITLGSVSARFVLRAADSVDAPKAALLAGTARKGELYVCDRLADVAARLLRERGVSYLAPGGNAYLSAEGLLLFVKDGTAKASMTPLSEPNRAFKRSGLKIIFAFLCNPATLQWTYRDIARVSGVSHGTVRYVLSDLADLGFVDEAEGDQRVLRLRPALAKRWAQAYGETLRPKLLRRRYRFRKEDGGISWRSADLGPLKAFWGGEPGADLLTGDLRPERYTLYTNEGVGAVAEALQALPDDGGPIETLDLFWDPEVLPANAVGPAVSAPPLLVFADLIASGSARNVDVAREIYERFFSD